MWICYLDETGCTGTLPTATSDIQPIFAPTGVIVEQAALNRLTLDFLALKSRFYPHLTSAHYLDAVLQEVKGSDVRRNALSISRRTSRHAIGFLDHFVELLENHKVKIIGRVLVKGIGIPILSKEIYTSYVQSICSYFQAFLDSVGGTGFLIADSRTKSQNANLSHSIFTQKFSNRGDRYHRIIEMPTYGHSDNHAGLQMADLLCSALIFPFAVSTYCMGYLTCVHMRPGFDVLKARYGGRIRSLQFLFKDGLRMRGGITVADNLGQRPSRALFI